MSFQPRGPFAGAVLALVATVGPASAQATTARSLSSFEGIEEPLVRYAPATGTFKRDDFVDITDQGPGVFRITVRYRSDEWDADSDTPNKDRQRAEVKGLGVHQKTGETFEYATTWRTSPGFHVAGRFCHIFQLKSTDGDSGAPLVTISIDSGHERASVRVWSGPAKLSTNVREFAWTPGEWKNVRLRLKTSASGHDDGEVLASVDGDEFQGARGIAVYRTGATDYRPKWGLYRGVTAGLPLGDAYIEHKEVAAQKLDGAAKLTAEAEVNATAAAKRAETDPTRAMAFAEALAPNAGRAEAIERVFNRWTDQDPDAVLNWASTQAKSAELDSLLWYFATDTTLRYVAREKALKGATLIGAPERRAEAVEHVVLIWARSDPVAAKHWLESSPALTSKQRASIASKFPTGGA